MTISDSRGWESSRYGRAAIDLLKILHRGYDTPPGVDCLCGDTVSTQAQINELDA